MMSDVIVSIERSDLPELARRLQAVYPGPLMTEANIEKKIWGDPDHAPELNLALRNEETGRITAALLGVMRGKTAFVKLLTPHRDAAALDTLYATFEQRVIARGAVRIDVSGSAPNYVFPGVPAVGYTDLLTFFQRHGYEKVGDAFNMTAPLPDLTDRIRQDEEVLGNTGYTVHRLRPEDESEFRTFVQAHFSPNWVVEALGALEHSPVTAHIARYRGKIVAFAAAEVTNPGWFGPMGTEPAHRGRSLGRVLLWRCLQDLRDLGYRQVEIAWVGPLGFYAKWCDAHVSRIFWMLRKVLKDDAS